MREPVTIVIPHYRAEVLADCLQSLFAHSARPLRVIVVDDGGGAPSLQEARARFPGIEVISNEGNRGFSYSCNRGLEAAGTEYSVLLNDDTRVTANWLEPLIAAAEADEAIAACQPKLLSAADAGSFDYSGGAGGYIDRLGYTFCRGRLLDEVETDDGQYDLPADLFWTCGSAMLVRTEAVRRVGLLDLDFFMHFEEIDLCWRLRLAGYRLVAVPSSVIYHHAGRSLPPASFRKSYLNHRNNLVMLIKNLPCRSLTWLLPARGLLELAAALNYLLRGRLRAAAAPLAALLWCFTHPLNLLGRRRRSRGLATAGTDADRRGVYGGSILVQYFLRGRRRSRDFMAEPGS
ncbi:MAG: glycosyltransferase family 2 protein [Gemmatimonadetes bacterium]|nr:glycosyltransferase family 2 protein [Gemmatimonadota bacterium]